MYNDCVYIAYSTVVNNSFGLPVCIHEFETNNL